MIPMTTSSPTRNWSGQTVFPSFRLWAAMPLTLSRIYMIKGIERVTAAWSFLGILLASLGHRLLELREVEAAWNEERPDYPCRGSLQADGFGLLIVARQ